MLPVSVNWLEINKLKWCPADNDNLYENTVVHYWKLTHIILVGNFQVVYINDIWLVCCFCCCYADELVWQCQCGRRANEMKWNEIYCSVAAKRLDCDNTIHVYTSLYHAIDVTKNAKNTPEEMRNSTWFSRQMSPGYPSFPRGVWQPFCWIREHHSTAVAETWYRVWGYEFFFAVPPNWEIWGDGGGLTVSWN